MGVSVSVSVSVSVGVGVGLFFKYWLPVGVQSGSIPDVTAILACREKFFDVLEENFNDFN